MTQTIELPGLEGSKKQVIWANQLRKEFLADYSTQESQQMVLRKIITTNPALATNLKEAMAKAGGNEAIKKAFSLVGLASEVWAAKATKAKDWIDGNFYENGEWVEITDFNSNHDFIVDVVVSNL